MNYYNRNHAFQVSHVPSHFCLAVQLQFTFLKMESLQTLAIRAVPAPGIAAELFLLPCHTMYQKLKDRDYEKMRARFQQEHKKKFRSVLYDICLRRIYAPTLSPYVVNGSNRMTTYLPFISVTWNKNLKKHDFAPLLDGYRLSRIDVPIAREWVTKVIWLITVLW